MAVDPNIAHVLRNYPQPLADTRLEALGTGGGFSGARLWRLGEPPHQFCLRCWPEGHPDPERLRFIHRCLRHAVGQGCHFIPEPIATRRGKTFVESAGRLWQVEPWLAGHADYDLHPSPSRMRAALKKLAEFHVATASLDSSPLWTVSPAFGERRQQVRLIQQRQYPLLESRLRDTPSGDPLRGLGQRILAQFARCATAISRQLGEVERLLLPLQPCIRDIWHGNVLFEGDQVTGFVDFGSMRLETVAADIARLLGSMAGDDPDLWSDGLQAYQSVRPLLEPERKCITAFDSSSVLLSGLNWLRWIYLEERVFEDLAAVRARLAVNVQRLEHLAHRVVTR